MIAMALTCRPSLLLADEPTTALDATIQGQVLSILNEERVSCGMAVLLITHDLGVVAQIADSVGVMYAGRLVEYGSLEEPCIPIRGASWPPPPPARPSGSTGLPPFPARCRPWVQSQPAAHSIPAAHRLWTYAANLFPRRQSGTATGCSAGAWRKKKPEFFRARLFRSRAHFFRSSR